ncbi:MAG: DnaJ domain-containing protein [Planctomycetota bacterium]
MSLDDADHYAVLWITPQATLADVRAAFRQRLLGLHPDKAGRQVASGEIEEVLRAFETLRHPLLRKNYDLQRTLRAGGPPAASSLPHVTESARPKHQARAVLFYLYKERPAEALARLAALGPKPLEFLACYLEDEEIIDAAFLFGEYYQEQKAYFEALGWYQEVLRREHSRRQHRTCFAETVSRVKQLVLRHVVPAVQPRRSLEYLDRLERLGLDARERVEVYMRRSQCHRELNEPELAAAQLDLARSLAARPA